MHGHIHGIQGGLQTGYSIAQLNRTADTQRASEVRKKLAVIALAGGGENGDAVSEAGGASYGNSRQGSGNELDGRGRRRKETDDAVKSISFWA